MAGSQWRMSGAFIVVRSGQFGCFLRAVAEAINIEALRGIKLHQSTTSLPKYVEKQRPVGFFIRRHALCQRGFAVLGAASDCQDAFAPAGRNAGGVEHLHALFSGDAARRLCLRARDN